MPCKLTVCKSKSTKVLWQCRHVVCLCTHSVQNGIQHSPFMNLTSILFVCLLSILFFSFYSFDCSVLSVYRQCCECTVSAVATVTVVPMIILICFSIQLSISFARTFAIAGVKHIARWLVGLCLLAASQSGCLLRLLCPYGIAYSLLCIPCSILAFACMWSWSCVIHNSGEHTVTDVAATTTASNHQSHKTLPRTMANSISSI